MTPSVLGLAKLAKMAFDGADMAPLWQELTTRFASDATNAESCRNMAAALMDMSVIDQMHGNPERGLSFQAQALEMCRLYQIPAAADPARLTVLGFVIAGKINANTPVEFPRRRHRHHALPAVRRAGQSRCFRSQRMMSRLCWCPRVRPQSPCFLSWTGSCPSGRARC